MSGLPEISKKAKPCNAGDYVCRYARSKMGRGKVRHPGARTPAVFLMPSIEPVVMGSNAATYFVREERKAEISRRKMILLCVIALGGVAVLLSHVW